jgi:hypothetical protein
MSCKFVKLLSWAACSYVPFTTLADLIGVKKVEAMIASNILYYQPISDTMTTFLPELAPASLLMAPSVPMLRAMHQVLDRIGQFGRNPVHK